MEEGFRWAGTDAGSGGKRAIKPNQATKARDNARIDRRAAIFARADVRPEMSSLSSGDSIVEELSKGREDWRTH